MRPPSSGDRFCLVVLPLRCNLLVVVVVVQFKIWGGMRRLLKGVDMNDAGDPRSGGDGDILRLLEMLGGGGGSGSDDVRKELPPPASAREVGSRQPLLSLLVLSP